LKRKTFPVVSIGLLVIILFLFPSQFAPPSGLQSEEKSINVPRVYEELSNLSDKQGVNQGNALKIFYSNGSSQLLPIGYDGPLALSTMNVGNSSTAMIFINNQEKIDRSLLNVTYLNYHGYLVNNKVRVIILVGEQITHEAYVFYNVPSTYKESVISAAKELNGSIETMYTPYLPLITVTVPYGKIFDLASHVSVAHVWLDVRYRVCLDESVPLIKDPARWSAIESNYGSAINGSGVKIAILDTGIDSNHPDFFFPNGTSKIIANVSFVPDETTRDGYGHGTHCASIAAGTGIASGGKYVGVAHDALLMAVKVLSDGGWGYDSWVISGIQWAVNHSANVLSMSFGADINGDGSDPMSLAVDWAVDNGAVCCVAAGNAGPSSSTVGIPAVSKKAITVGASTKQDEIVGFSSRGPSADLRIKPDVIAPGYMIIAARASGTSMGSPIDQDYTSASGTSMATPHVAGAAALLLQMHPNWEPLYIKAALMNWAKSLSSVDVLDQGAGRIDCSNSANASALVIQPSSSFGIVTEGQTESATLTFINLVNSPLTAYLSTNTTCEGEPVNYVHTNVTAASLPANGNATVLLQAGPINVNASEGWYQGQLTVELSNGQKGETPYFFGVFSILNTCMYDTDNKTPIYAMTMVASYPDLTYAAFSWEGTNDTFYLKSGNYSICAQMAWIDQGQESCEYDRMFMIQKKVFVPRLSTINVSLSLADARISHIPTVDSRGNNLTVHSFIQWFCGGPTTSWGSLEWAMGSAWFGLDLNRSYLTFYSTEYDPPDRLSEALGYYASNKLLSEVYLTPFKFWNVSSLPSEISYSTSDLATYYVFFDMPETYPEKGLNLMNAFWWTWEHLGGFQFWGWDIHPVLAGTNATYYLAPDCAWYWMYYMPTYKDHGPWKFPAFGPIQEEAIGDWDNPPSKGEEGTLSLGQFEFAPYQPGLSLDVSKVEDHYSVNLTGDIWSNLSWPHWQWWYLDGGGPISPFPNIYPTYHVYVNDTLYDQGNLTGTKGVDGQQFEEGVDWLGISKTWNITAGKVLLQLTLPSMATLSKHTIYNMSFTLGGTDITPPKITGVFHPLNYTPDKDIKINFTALDVGLGIKSHTLRYSFDNGTTWHDASYQEFSYVIPYENADSLAILINVTDDTGNSAQYLTKPAALNSQNKLTLEEKVEDSDWLVILGNLTSIQGCPIPSLAVLLFKDGVDPIYMGTGSWGNFTYRTLLQTGINRVDALVHKVGLYQSLLNWVMVFDGPVIDQAFVSDERCDVGSVQTIYFHARWGCNSSDIIGGSIFINGTEYITNGTGWISFEAEYSTVGKRQWTVTGMAYRGMTAYYQFAGDPYIIWDRVQITLNAPSTRINVGSDALISWNGRYEYDDKNFNGSISLNDTTVKDAVGRYSYAVKNILDPVYDLTAFTSNSVNAIFDKISIVLSTAKPRIDVGTEAAILWNGIYKYDGILFNGTVAFNDTLTKSEVGRYGYTVSGINGDSYGITVFESNSVPVIFDRIRITEGGVSSSHCQVGLTQTVWLRAEYEYDSVRFDDTKGILFLNGEPMDWSDKNSRWEYSATSDMIDLKSFRITAVDDDTHQLTAFNDLVGEKSILWDEIEIKKIMADTTTFGITNIKVMAIYTSTKDPVTDAKVTVNGIECTETETGLYTCQVQDWSLTRKINVQVDLPNFTKTTATTSTIHIMNLTIYLATLSAMIASIIVIALKKRRPE